jgi:DNA-binding CsgD family transcriptional regulator
MRTTGPAGAGRTGGDGTLVLTPLRGIRSADAGADRILEAADALVAIDGRLVAVRPADDRRLQAAFDGLSSRTSASGESSCIALPMARRRGGADYVLLLCRAEAGTDAVRSSGGDPEPRIVMVIHAFDARPALPIGLLQESLGLTAAEARLAATFSGGCSPRQAAIELGVSLSTVRTHLRAIYRKTGTSGQVDLAWRIAAVSTAAAAAVAAASSPWGASAACSFDWTRRESSHESAPTSGLRLVARAVNQ